jgi:hypothetical protein
MPELFYVRRRTDGIETVSHYGATVPLTLPSPSGEGRARTLKDHYNRAISTARDLYVLLSLGR